MSAEHSRPTVEVATGARLHFGPLSYFSNAGRHFGGIGMMIAQPGCSVTARCGGTEADAATGEDAALCRQILLRYRQQAPADWQPAVVNVSINASIPAHRGLGSGTQMALAVGECLARLAGVEADVSAIAQHLGRGARSAIGLYGYQSGGFLVDAGQAAAGDLGSLACRVAVPESWRIVLVCPEAATGLSGESESSVLRELAPMPESLAGRLSRLTLTDLLPALQEANCSAFCTALEEYGRRVGEFFRPVQGDVFAHPAMAALAEQLRLERIAGAAQSSWGPTLVIPVESDDAAEDVQHRIMRMSSSPLVCQVVRPLNSGRSLRI